MNDMDEKNQDFSFLQRIWRMVTSVMTEWFSGILSAPDPGHENRSSRTAGRENREESFPLQLEEVREVFLPGFRQGENLLPSEEKQSSFSPEDLSPPETAEQRSLYELAMQYLEKKAQQSEIQRGPGDLFASLHSPDDMREIFPGSEVSGLTEKPFSDFIRTGSMLPGGPDPDRSGIFPCRNGEPSSGESLEERMKESVKLLNRISDCCENLRRIVNEGMNI